MRAKLTDQLCRQRPPKAGSIDIWDLALPGLCLRIFPSGRRSFSMMPRTREGHQRRITNPLGYPVLTLVEARRWARDLICNWSAGADLPEERPKLTTADAIDLWLKLGSVKEARAQDRMVKDVRRALQPWASRSVRIIKRPDIQKLVDEAISSRGSSAAALMHTFLHVFFKWALKRDYIDSNPAANLEVPAVNEPRRRTLDDDELRRVWLASDELGWPEAHIYKLLILTGARRNEVANLPWAELNLGSREWVLPAARAKNGVEHLVPLSPQAMAIIESLPRVDSPTGLLFPNSKGKPVGSYLGRGKRRLDKLSGVSDWVTHDLRRTVASGLQRLGVKLEITEAVLNHVGGSRSGIVGTYQVYQFVDEKRHALEAWARHVDRVVTGEAHKVIPMPKRGA